MKGSTNKGTTGHHTGIDFPFAPVPETLLFDPNVSDKAVRVWAVLARHGQDPNSCFPSHARIASLIGGAERSIQRPLRELESAGWIRRTPRYADSGQRITDGFFVYTLSAQERAPTALFNAEGTAQRERAPQRDEREKSKESQGEREEPRPDAEARAIVKNVWERSTPKPATPFIACVKVAQALLAAGHRPRAIEDAMLAVPTISIRWVEGELRRPQNGNGSRPPANVVRNDPKMDALLRALPEGPVDMSIP